MSSINVKRGVQFRPELFKKSDHSEWLDAVGAELEKKGLTVKLGESGWNAKSVTNGAELKAAIQALTSAAAATSAPAIPPTAGTPSPATAAKAYVSDLLQALDDLVKDDAKVAKGDAFDFSKGSKLSKALGVDDGKWSNYGSMSTTDFGIAAKKKPEATMLVDGVTLQVRAPTGLDLSTIPHMSTESLRNAPATYGRDGEEVEATRVVTGISKAQAVAIAGTALNDLQRPRSATGLSLGQVPLDEMTWDSDAHALRRANPYVSFSLDSRSLEMSPKSGEPRVAIGRDFFFDAFMAKKDLATGKLTKDLQKAQLMYRTRIRYGGSDTDPFEGTRVLIGMKQGTAVDEAGNKHAAKIDSRSDTATQPMFDGLQTAAETGRLGAGWGSTGKVAPAAIAAYRFAVQQGITDDVGGETNVLALEPGAVARQIRGRFHLNETSLLNLVTGFSEAGEPKLTQLQTLIQAAPDFAADGERPSKAQLLAQVGALLDRSAIVKAASDGLKAIDPTLTVDKALIDRLWPGQTITKPDTKLQRAVVDAIRSQYDAFSQNVDDLQRSIAGTTDKSVRDAGSANDVRDFLKQKAAVASFMAKADATAAVSGVSAGNAASYTAYAKKVLAMADGKEKTDLLQSIGIGTTQLAAMDDASFGSPVKVGAALLKKQTFEPFLTEFDAQRAGPNAAAFSTELGAFLAAKKSPALQAAADKAPVLDSVRKNLVTAHVEILHRMIEGAASWAQAAWFDNYRQAMIGVNPGGYSNFIIGSMDYTEFYDAKTGLDLSFQDRVKRTPLDPSKMTGAMLSNDIQIELEQEEAYTGAIRTAQYAVNGAVAGVLMDYALSKNAPGLTAGDAAGFEKWFAAQAALDPTARKAFVADVAAFSKARGSPIDITKGFEPLVAQEQAIRLLVGFAQQKNPALVVTDRAAVETWYRTQAQLPEEQLSDFLTEVARYAASVKLEVPLSPNLLRTLDFKPFAATNVDQPVTGHAQLVDTLSVAEEIWTMVKAAGQDLSDARGREVKKVLKANGVENVGWDPPTAAKGDYAIDLALQ